MDALIAYGSLIKQSELIQSEFPLDSTYPIIVRGFKRMFSQEPSWRSGQGEHRAVLNVLSSQQHWLNGLLISGLDEDFFIELDEREKGYNRIWVDPSYLHGYDSSYIVTGPQNIYIYTGKLDKQSGSILPNTLYLDACLEGARQWGMGFYGDFLDSTFVKNNILLRTYVQQMKLGSLGSKPLTDSPRSARISSEQGS